MRILYGVQTTGHGHLVRATPIIRQLRELGHEVSVILSGPPPDPAWVERLGAPLRSRPGLSFAADGGRIRYVRTAMRARPLTFLRDVFRNPVPAPDLVVTDFEPITAWLARRRGLRSIGIGHQYAFAWPTVPRVPGNLVTRLVLEQFAPVTVPLGTHWGRFGAPILPPTVDPEIRSLARGPVEPGLVLVYLAFEPQRPLAALLQRFAQLRFRVYARVPEAVTDGNVQIVPVSRHHFLTDLGRCAGVIANAGFTLATECLYLGIPLLVKPIAGQVEQESNALALAALGLGVVTNDLAREDVPAWLGRAAPPRQRYPDVTAEVVQWLHAGSNEPPEALSDRLWAAVRG